MLGSRMGDVGYRLKNSSSQQVSCSTSKHRNQIEPSGKNNNNAYIYIFSFKWPHLASPVRKVDKRNQTPVIQNVCSLSPG